MKVRYKIVKFGNGKNILRIAVPAMFRHYLIRHDLRQGYLGFACIPYSYPNKPITRGRIENVIRRNRPDMAILFPYTTSISLEEMIELDLGDDDEKFFSWSYIAGLNQRVLDYKLVLQHESTI